MSEATGRRLDYVDVAKGIGIILVVYGHVVRGLVSAGIAPAVGALQVVDYVVYTAHMPLFFVLSGLFFARSYARGAGTFWRGRLTTILWPYLLWSLVQGSAQVVMSSSGATNTAMGWGRLAEIGWAPISPFWFLYALFAANLLMALLRSLPIALVIAAAAAAFFGVHALLGAGTVWDVSYGFFYFACGVGVAQWRLLERLPDSPVRMAGALLLWGALALLAWDLGIPERLPVFATVAGIAALVMTAAWLARTPLRGLLVVLGECSMGIYVMHILAVVVARTVMVKLLGIDSLPVLIVLLTCVGVAGPCIAHLLAVRAGIGRLVGLPATPRLRTLVGLPDRTASA